MFVFHHRLPLLYYNVRPAGKTKCFTFHSGKKSVYQLHKTTGVPAETSSIRGDVDTAVSQVGGDGHKLVDESRPTHQSEGADQFVMISDYAQNVSCGCTENRVCEHLRKYF